jgi:CBS domain-containing protein
VAPEEDPAQTPVRDIMSRSPATLAPSQDVHAAALAMAAHQVRRLPVVENSRLVGILSLGDLAKSHRYDMEAAQALSEISENILRK